MKELLIWELRWGRASSGTVLIGADTFPAAVSLGVEYIKSRNPEWKDVDSSDIIHLKRLEQSIMVED